jgi:hypothetical protein
MGCYFRFSGDPGGWVAACVNGGAPATLSIPLAPNEVTQWHRFRMTRRADGVHAFVDGQPISGSPIGGGSLPALWHTPTLGIRTVAGDENRLLAIDYFALRWEIDRV